MPESKASVIHWKGVQFCGGNGTLAPLPHVGLMMTGPGWPFFDMKSQILYTSQFWKCDVSTESLKPVRAMLKYVVNIVILSNVSKCYTNIKGFVDCVPDLIKKNCNSSNGMYQLLQMEWIWRENGRMIKIFRLIHEQRTIHVVFFGPLNTMFALIYGYWQSQNRGITYAQHVLRNELYGQIKFD